MPREERDEFLKLYKQEVDRENDAVKQSKSGR